MEPMCEFCGVVGAVVYCKSDLAQLCLRCDHSVHSANSLSRRHHRSLLCDKCNSQPAIARCVDENMSLCQNCDWNRDVCCSGSGHRHHTLDGYSGCPSLAELAKLWSSVFYEPSGVGFDGGWSLGSTLDINENRVSNNCLEARDNEGSFGLVTNKLNELESCSKLEPWMAPSSSVIQPNLNNVPFCTDQAPFFTEEPSLSKGSSNINDLRLHDTDDLCGGLDMDDVALNFENSDEIFGCSQGQPRFRVEDVDMDYLLMEKNFAVSKSEGSVENAFEVFPKS